MLSAAHRLTDAPGFRETTRRGVRGASGTVVTHLSCTGSDGAPPRVGFVVGKSVGVAVVRNRVRRRLRHLVASRLGLLPRGAVMVVRALPKSAGAGYDELALDLDRCLSRSLNRSADRSLEQSAGSTA